MKNIFYSFFSRKSIDFEKLAIMAKGKQPMKDQKRITFDLPNGVATQLSKLAKSEGRSIASQIRLFIADAVTRRNAAQAEASK